ncbi:tripartite-type tricarboxylate transporter receptor subunit TctC [Pseudacidovorax sp. 1753]|uniref:tripartite tricarboxylate transporter substrate-binding protein n=1 Tax=Pseudacidovorax sp. 1753 TaxID=3156419 RepID=UPI00339B55AF
MTRFQKALAIVAAVLAPLHASAQSFPSHPITLVVPFAPGGPTDRVARDLAESLRKPLGGATVVVDNAAGAGGAVGAAKVAHAAADGYTLLLHHIGMATMPGLVRKLPFSVEKDFAYLGIVNDVPMTLIGRPTLPASNFKELVAWIGQNKGHINLGNAGVGSASHLCGMLLQQALGTEMTAVPYKGTGPAMTDLMGGQIDLMCDQTTSTTAHIEAKKVKVFGVTSPTRLATPALREVPTLQEAGLKNFQVSIFHGLYAPKGTPPAVLDRLHTALEAALRDPDFIQREQALGAVVAQDGRTQPEGHRQFVAAEIARWTPLIKGAGVYAD